MHGTAGNISVKLHDGGMLKASSGNLPVCGPLLSTDKLRPFIPIVPTASL
ncbi:MAG: hypothetical protein ABI919_06355 [Ramlibacter sp.]